MLDAVPATRWRSVFVAIVLLALAFQAALLAWISTTQFRTFALTIDFVLFDHAFSEIAAGRWNPPGITYGGNFFQNHGEIMMWILAIVFRWADPAAVLLIVQDLAVVGTTATIGWWAFRVVERDGGEWAPATAVIAAIPAVLAAINPWFLWANAYDFHFEALATFFLVLAAYGLWARRVWLAALAVVGCLLCGDVSATYLMGIAFAAFALRGRGRIALGVVTVACVLGFLAVMHSLGVKQGADLGALYGHLAPGNKAATESSLRLALTVLTHPVPVLAALWSQRLNIYAQLAPGGGLIGFLSPWSWAIAAVPFLENNLVEGPLFSAPSFQNVPTYAATSVGAFFVLWWLRARLGGASVALALLLLVNGVIWSATVIPHLGENWLVVGPQARDVIQQAYDGAPRDAQILTSQGVLGRFGVFAAPHWYEPSTPLRTTPVTILITPYDGINYLDVNQDLANLAELMHRGATLHAHAQTAWWLSYDPAIGDSYLHLPDGSPSIEAWTVGADTGRAVLDGPQRDWHLHGESRPGYVLNRDYWREPLGSYRAELDFANQVPVFLEIRNASGDVLIYRKAIAPGPRRTLTFNFRHANHVPERQFRGAGIVVFSPIPGPVNNALEIRLFSDGNGAVDVWRAALIKETSK